MTKVNEQVQDRLVTSAVAAAVVEGRPTDSVQAEIMLGEKGRGASHFRNLIQFNHFSYTIRSG